MQWGVERARRDIQAGGWLPVFCCWSLGLTDGLRQTDADMPDKPVAVAVLLLVSHGA